VARAAARDDVVLLDNRNHFEVRLGRFRGAVDPQVHNFRDFVAWVQAHAPAWRAARRPVAMYCTGGIRCDKTAPWLRSLGLDVPARRRHPQLLPATARRRCATGRASASCSTTASRSTPACARPRRRRSRCSTRRIPTRPGACNARAGSMARRLRCSCRHCATAWPPAAWASATAASRRCWPSSSRAFRPSPTGPRGSRAATCWTPTAAPLAADAPCAAGSLLWYWRDPPPEPRVPFEIELLHQDEHLVVVDKPHFLPVIPSGRHLRETVLVRLRRQLGIATLAPMHRLDRETAGVLVFTVRLPTNAPRTTRCCASARCTRSTRRSRRGAAISRCRCSRATGSRSPGRGFMQVQVVDGEPNAEALVELVERRRRWRSIA
jgi:rhodanese-related sulfurtransferase